MLLGQDFLINIPKYENILYKKVIDTYDTSWDNITKNYNKAKLKKKDKPPSFRLKLKFLLIKLANMLTYLVKIKAGT